MRTTVIALALMMATTAAMGEEMNDTTIHYNGHTLTITGSSSVDTTIFAMTSPAAMAEEWEVSEIFSLPIISDLVVRNTLKKAGRESTKKKTGFKSRLRGFHVGFSQVIDPYDKNFDVNMARSVEIGFTIAGRKKAFSDNVGIVGALGLNWRNFKLSDSHWLEKSGDHVNVVPVPEGYDLDYSKIVFFGFNIPVALQIQQTKRNGFHILFGPQADIRVARRMKARYTNTEGEDKVIKRKNVRAIPVGLDLLGEIGWGDFSLYAKYTPTPIFDSKYGPINQALTMGVKLNW